MKECNFMVYYDKVRFCKKLNCVCYCYSCNNRLSCPLFTKCKYKDYKLIDNADSLYSKAAKKLTHALKSLRGNIPKKEFYSGLLYSREKNLLIALSESPQNIYDAYIVNKYFIQGNYPRDIEPYLTNEVKKFSLWLFYRESYLNKVKRIKNSDVFIFATSNGEKKLEKIEDSPISSINEDINQINNMFSHKKINQQTNEIIECYSKKMIPVLNWCIGNHIPTSFEEPRFFINYCMRKLKKNGNFSYKTPSFEPLYWNNLIKMILRYMYRFPEIKKTLEKYTKHFFNSLIFPSLRKISIRLEAYKRCKNFDWYLESILPDESVSWPLNFNKKSLWASSVFMALFSEKYQSVTSTRQMMGWTFEEKMRVELIDRTFKILGKNIDTPVGEIDLLIKKNKEIFLLELKDYILWYENWYASSRRYNARENSLKKSFDKISNKINWLDLNRNNYNLGNDRIKGAAITSLSEKILGFQNISIIAEKDIDNLFGKSKFKSYHKTIYEYAKKNEKNLDKILQFPNMKPKICPSHPACIYLAVDKNRIDCREVKGYISTLQLIGGGKCPIHEGLCMWVLYCFLGEDPCIIKSGHPIHR